MAEFYSQVEALNHLSSTAKTSGRILTLEEVMDTSQLDVDGNDVIAGISYDQSQSMLFNTSELDIGVGALLGTFACRIIRLYPDATEYLSSRFGLSPYESDATIIRGQLEYRRPGEERVRAKRLAAYCLRSGAAQLLDAHFEHHAAIPSLEILGEKGLLRGYATKLGQLHDDHRASRRRDSEIAVLHHAINTYPQLEIMGAELGFTATMLPHLAEWIRS
jgi:hypothetical protein